MAFQSRSRNPLLDSNTQAAIEKRGKELLGLVLIGLGLLAAAMIASYTPDDPNWMVSTDAPVQNWLGRTGASIAAPLFMVAGWGGWAIAATFFVWGLRFLLHWGAERAFPRAAIAPIGVAVCSVYASTLIPGAEWRATHSFGLGGLFGDTVLGVLLNLLPIGSHVALKTLSVALAFGMLGLGAFVLGFTMADLKRYGRFLLVGVIMTYATIASLLGRGASSSVQAAKAYHAQRLERAAAEKAEAAERALAEEAEVFDDEPYYETEPDVPEAKGGLLSRVPGLIRRAEPVVEEPETGVDAPADEFDTLDGDDRISAKIANAVRVRRAANVTPENDPNLPLTKGRGRRPAPLILNPRSDAELRAEPPLTSDFSDLPAEPVIAAPRAVDVPSAPELAMPQAAQWEPTSYHAESEGDDLDDHGYYSEPDLDSDPEVAAPVAAQPTLRIVTPVAPTPVSEPRKVVVENNVRTLPEPSERAKAEARSNQSFVDGDDGFELPPHSLLTSPESIERFHLSDDALEENARMLESVLDDYGVKGEIVSVRPGPVVTLYELEPAPGLKASRVIGLADDIARSMSALSARVSTVPGRSVIGIELPNEKRETVVLREILSSRDFGDGNQSLPLALGKDIGGDSVVANLAKMPHLLIAGTTGSGKSVAINTMILSLLYKLTPDECRLIMIDPKMLELSVYDGIPHLLSPVVTDPKKAVVALKWVVGEMEDRYRKMSKMGVRNIGGYNGRVKDALSKGEMFSRTVQTGFDDDTGEPVFETEEFAPEALPYIVVIVDEMADLMMVAGKEIEACIQRLAQMARASGIHLIMATQRPSVDVITGTIKANFPTRISFQVTSKIDSRTILGEMGAEQLLGMGDMLYMAGGGKITRCHGPFVSDEEVEEVVNHLKQFGPPDYVGGVVDGPADENASNIDAVLGLNTGGNTNGEDALYDSAVAIVIKDRKCSTSYIQRKLAIGYNKAARLVEQMEDEGLVSAANHVGKREILVPEQE